MVNYQMNYIARLTLTGFEVFQYKMRTSDVRLRHIQGFHKPTSSKKPIADSNIVVTEPVVMDIHRDYGTQVS